MFAVSCLFVCKFTQLEVGMVPVIGTESSTGQRWKMTRPELLRKRCHFWPVWDTSQLWWRRQTQPNVGMHSMWRPLSPTFWYSLTSWKCDVKFNYYSLCAFIRRSKLSYEDGSGNAAIKTILLRPSEVSLRSRVEPVRGLVNLLQVPTSPQCDIWRGWQNHVVLSEMVLDVQQRCQRTAASIH